MKGYRMDDRGGFHAVDVPDDSNLHSAEHRAGAPSKHVHASTGKVSADSASHHPPTRPNKVTGHKIVKGPGHKLTKPGFKPHKVAVSAAPHTTTEPLHKAAATTKHSTSTPAAPRHTMATKRARGPSLGGGPAGAAYPTDASGNPLDSSPWRPGVPYENALFADLDGSQTLGQVSVYDGSFTALETAYDPSRAVSQFNNPKAGTVNGHAYLYTVLHGAQTVPPGGYYSDLIHITSDLGIFQSASGTGGNATVGGNTTTTAPPRQAPYDNGSGSGGAQTYDNGSGSGGAQSYDDGSDSTVTSLFDDGFGSGISQPYDSESGGVGVPQYVAPSTGMPVGPPATTPSGVVAPPATTLSGVAAPPATTLSGVAAPLAHTTALMNDDDGAQ